MRRGYTITELLMVVLIIAVLAALLFPAAMGAKKASGKVVCASNMHQIYLAAKLYENDNGGYPDGLTEPAFKTYYPTFLACPESKDDKSANSHAVDYMFIGLGPRNRRGPALDACRTARGSDVPLVLDQNHIPSEISTVDTTSKILLVRENGAYSAVPAIPKTSPCDLTQVPTWYNY